MDWTFLVSLMLGCGVLGWIWWDNFMYGVVGGIVLFFLAGRKG